MRQPLIILIKSGMNYNENYRKCKSKFTKSEFSAPETSYSPIYSWVWNAPVTEEETNRQLDEFVRLGIKAFYIIPEPKTFRPDCMPTMLEPDYLTEPYYKAYAYALKSAFSRGMIAWLYDEGGWPSGGACGRVLLKRPELARRGLGQIKTVFKAGQRYVPSKEAATGFLQNGKMLEENYVFTEDTEVSEYFSERFYFRTPGSPDFPDLTLAESTDAFINETFPGYASTLSEYFGSRITAVFSDEASGPTSIPFRAEIEEEYERRYGCSIRPHLDVLWKNNERLRKEYENVDETGKAVKVTVGRRSDDIENVTVPEESAQAIIRWYDLCSELFCKNYLLREKRWSNEHNMSFVGHLNGDDDPLGSIRAASYHIMRALRCFDIPAVDAIWRQIFPSKQKLVGITMTAENRFFPRYASSAAAQIGSDLSATESFGVYGQSITYNEMRYVLGFQAVRGINVFNLMIKNYGKGGFFMTGERPDFCEELQNPNELKTFNEYCERLSYITSLGDRLVDTALYLPICDIWSGANTKTVCMGYEKAGYELEEDGIYFDILDDDVIACCDNAALDSGVIAMGKAKYKTVIIPPAKYVTDNTIKRLERFIASGGRVITVKNGLTPKILGAETVESCKGVCSSDTAIDFPSGNLRVYSRSLENGRMDIIFNQGFEKETVTLSPSGKAPILIDVTRGKLLKLEVKDGMSEFMLESGEVAALLYTDEDFELDNDTFSNEVTLNGEYLFKKNSQIILGDMNIYRRVFDEPYLPIQPGDWRTRLGNGFSGTCSYLIEFKRPDMTSDRFNLDLGRVDYSAEVFLNGEPVGVLIMPPYKLTLPADMLKDTNALEIRVTGSAANEYKHTKTFEKFAKWQLSPYHDRQTVFCEDNLSAGLFGPIKIRF